MPGWAMVAQTTSGGVMRLESRKRRFLLFKRLFSCKAIAMSEEKSTGNMNPPDTLSDEV